MKHTSDFLLEELIQEHDVFASTNAQDTIKSKSDNISLVGECIHDYHPTLIGRYCIRWSETSGKQYEKWIPALQGLSLRIKDQVLLQQPANWPEPLIVGVIDGFKNRPPPKLIKGAVFSLKTDERLTMETEDGKSLCEFFCHNGTPTLRLLSADLSLDIPGDFSIKASSINLSAQSGCVEIDASDDVNVSGELINLN